MDQLALTFALPGLGHNHPPERLDPVAAVTERLGETHADLVSRFRDLELGCARVPDPIDTEEDAAIATDFIAQCQAHIRQAETAHKREKEPFLTAWLAGVRCGNPPIRRFGPSRKPSISAISSSRDGLA